MAYINLNEYRIIALQRSGHHAIINWIISNIKGRLYFLNNCCPEVNPYSSFNPKGSVVDIINIDNEIKSMFSKKDYLLFNYENKSLKNIFSETFYNNIDNWVGKSKNIRNILILRDPFNNFASKYKWAISGTQWVPSLDDIKKLPEIWKTYAREYLDETKFIKNDKFVINYNKWFSDKFYREYLAKELNLLTIENGIKTIAKWGPNTWGDSFDNLDFDGRANEMKVFDRWRYYATDKFFISLFQDKELIELSLRIFGHIQDTEILYQ